MQHQLNHRYQWRLSQMLIQNSPWLPKNLMSAPPSPRPPAPHGHLFPCGNKWQVRNRSEKWRSAVDVIVICARVQRTWNCAKGAVKYCYATWNLRKRKFRDDIVYALTALDLRQIDIVCNALQPFIAIFYYVTCCRDLCVATPLAGDVGDALPNVVC